MKFVQLPLQSFQALLLGSSSLTFGAIGNAQGEQFNLPELLEDTLAFYCYDCHNSSIKKGGLNLEDTPFNLTDPHHFEKWAHVFDRVESGEMPPQEEEQPDKKETAAFLKELFPTLLQADRKAIEAEGRVHSRRLSRPEYENTLHDLLGIRIPLAKLLPNDESDGEFQTVADAQQLSHFHLNQYLQTADTALHIALSRSQRGLKPYSRKFWPDRLIEPGNFRGGNYRGPQKKDGRIYSWSRGIAFNGRLEATRVPEGGWYRITIKNLQAINPGEDGVVWGTLKTGAGIASEAQLFLAQSIEATSKPRDVICDTWMEEGHLLVLEPKEGGAKSVFQKPSRSHPYYHNRDLQKEGYTAFAFDRIEMTRIYPGGYRQALRDKLLPGITFSDGRPVLTNPTSEINRLIATFASQAFRRPVKESQLTPYQSLALQRYEETEDLFEALHEGYRAILCSPHFLTFVEAPGPLNNHAIASRLSYLLWSSLPDPTLRKLADQGQLTKPKVLTAQIDRMLADPKSERFIENFTDQWLQLNEIDFTSPDPRRFRKFDDSLQASMLLETRAFFRELLDKDLSVRHFVDSDFGMLDTRLQRHYLLDHLKLTPGGGIQKVALRPEDRSGLTTQASILKVTADGSVTSPVIRGVWIGERILGLHIPPPPANVPAIEPDIRGAISIRDELEKHRADPSCAACHTKIDPQGFALESFDPIGQSRTYYGKNAKSATVDPSGITPDGETFPDVEGWKNIYANRPRMLAKAFLNHFLTYATGADSRFADRPTINRILNETKDHDYGLRSLIHAALTSDIFLQK
ncbi:MAG: DUF1592 domain-containing protein [Roseibacillus sp.]